MNDELNQQRRKVLKATISASTLALVAASGLLLPQRLLAHWPKGAFEAESVEDALLALVGDVDEVDESLVKFKIGSPPSYAVNGATVPFQIESKLTNIERVYILVEKNPFPLAMSMELTPVVQLPLKSMIKIREDSLVIAVVRAEGKLYKTSRFVEVDIGGCG
ncbi:MAG: transcriptional initiation protein Tat [Gammaproteobacteria bacterium]|nr:MAG: transcriptional initiation protein Tat [Gammaproteobacteria bacterium]